MSTLPDEVRALIEGLGLEPHPEGGWFRETYRADEVLAGPALPPRYRGGERAISTAIYYLLGPRDVSAMHRVASDELFHHYAGDAVEQLVLGPEPDASRVVTLGCEVLRGERPQSLVPRGAWQGARVAPGGRYALMGCTVAPGFDFADFELGLRSDLVARWPEHQRLIEALTR